MHNKLMLGGRLLGLETLDISGPLLGSEFSLPYPGKNSSEWLQFCHTLALLMARHAEVRFMKHGMALGQASRPSSSAHIRHFFRTAIAICFLLLTSACASVEQTMVATDPRVLGNYELKNVTVRLVPNRNEKVDPDDYARMTRHLAGEIRNSLARQGMGTSPIDVDVTIKGLNFANAAGIILGGSFDYVLAEVNITDPADPQRKLASFQTFKTQQYAMGGLIGVAVRQNQAPAEIRLAQQLAGEIWKKLNER